jgi:D-sedoheptulose 7-phosphate isomerase
MSSICFSVDNYIQQHYTAFQSLDFELVNAALDLVVDTISKNKKIITCGNGGSALTASHYITDWNKMYNISSGSKIQGICLTDNVGLITAFGNDLDYESVFSGQLDAIMDEGDLLVAVSGSGNSPNILSAINKAHSLGGVVLGVLGYDGGKAKALCDALFHVPSWDMQICEDIHLSFGHLVMKRICGSTIQPVIGN